MAKVDSVRFSEASSPAKKPWRTSTPAEIWPQEDGWDRFSNKKGFKNGNTKKKKKRTDDSEDEYDDDNDDSMFDDEKDGNMISKMEKNLEFASKENNDIKNQDVDDTYRKLKD